MRRVLVRIALALAFVFVATSAMLAAETAKATRGVRIDVIIELSHPLTNQDRGQLTRGGVRIYDAVTPTTLLAKVRESAIEGLQNSPLVVSIEPVAATQKLSPALRAGTPPPHALEEGDRVSVFVRFYDDVPLGAAVSLLRRNGFVVPKPGRLLFDERLLAIGTLEQIEKLTTSSLVRYVTEISPPPETTNTTAAAISNVDVIQGAPSNLDGTGVIMGIWDGGEVRTTHQNFGGRVTLVETSSIEDHSTHVAGTMIGNGTFNATARGMSPAGGQLFSWDFDDDVPSEQSDGVDNQHIVLANHSWGWVLGWGGDPWSDTGNDALFGAYDGDAVNWDNLVRNKGLIVVNAAGNDGNDCDPADATDCDGFPGGDGFDYDTIGSFGNAKNIITVGAIQDNGTTATDFSSAGPSDDGRFKPDIVANGDSLTSSCGASDSDYCSMSGTSMACPTVSGTTGLLVQRYRQKLGTDPSPDIVKALLVNSAIDLGRAGPDYLYGFGLMDAEAAEATVDVVPVRIVTGSVGTGESDEYVVSVPSGATDFRVTLNWIDPAGAANDGANDTINNLDLRLIAPDGTIFYPFTGPGMGNVTGLATTTGPNGVDTVEHVRVNPASGIWKAIVAGTAVAGTQNYALVSNQSFTLSTEPDIKVNAALDFNEVCYLSGFEEQQVSIFNTGGADLYVHSVTVTSGATHFSVLPSPSQPFIVGPGAHVDVTVRYDPASAGAHTGVLTITTNDADQPTINLPMTGTGGPPGDVYVSGSTDFGTVCAGEIAERTISVCNDGTCPLTVSSAVLSNSEFTIVTNPFPATIAAGSCLDLVIRFTPTSDGPKTATLTLSTNDPDEPTVVLNLTGTTPEASIAVPATPVFDATVIQDVGACKTVKAVPVTNNGSCPLVITNIAITGPDAADFAIEGIDLSFPISVPAGHMLGEGHFAVAFMPTVVDRTREAQLEITYQSDTVVPTTTTITIPLCGEGVRTGARVLVSETGTAKATVEKLQLQRIGGNRNKKIVDTIDTSNDLSLVTVSPTESCTTFSYHREYGTVSNPIQLLPGSYQVTATIINSEGKRRSKTVAFNVDTCTFNEDIVIDF